MAGMIIKIGGVGYTVDQVYLAFYGNDEDRKYSTFADLFDYFKNASEAEKLESALKSFETQQKETEDDFAFDFSDEEDDDGNSFF